MGIDPAYGSSAFGIVVTRWVDNHIQILHYNDGTLDKESTSYNDIFDAFRLALKFYHFEDSSSE
jgi:hypothetical protein